MEGFACLKFLVGEFHDKDTVFRHKTNQHDDTDLREDIHCLVSEIHEDESAEYRQGYGEHDDEGVAETFKLRCQNQVDKQDGKTEGEEQ